LPSRLCHDAICSNVALGYFPPSQRFTIVYMNASIISLLSIPCIPDSRDSSVNIIIATARRIGFDSLKEQGIFLLSTAYRHVLWGLPSLFSPC
jgi:hypothetical protein